MNIDVQSLQSIAGRQTGENACGIAFEISDLIYYFGSGNTPTGIQRVQQELALEYMRHSGGLVDFVIYDGAVQKWRSVDPVWLQFLISTARSFRGRAAEWKEEYFALAKKISSFRVRQFERGNWLVNVGASWGLPSYFVQIRQLQRRGIRCAFFMHDCIPVRHPAYFEYNHTVDYSYWLLQIRETADLVICNSEATRADYIELIHPDNVENVVICRLNASRLDEESTPEAEAAAADLLADLQLSDDDFVLSVGTIEPRKNHITLVHVWDRLRNAHPAKCPKLLCVGRIGWKSDAVISQAKALGLCEGHVHFTGAVSDDVLAQLYRRCLFTVYLSYCEGWGLPVTESLQAGKPCLVGSSAALREAGAGCAIHVDERSETSVYDAVETLIEDEASRLAASQTIRESYEARSWSDIADEICDLVQAANVCKGQTFPLTVLEPNALYHFGRVSPVTDFANARAAELFCLGDAWHQPEGWGAWSCKEVAEFGFRIERSASSATMFLGVIPPPGGAKLTISVDGKQVRAFPGLSARKILRLELREWKDEDATSMYVPVRIRTSTSRIQNMQEIEDSRDSRQLGLGFLFLVVFDRGAVAERMEFLEKIVTGEI